MLRVGSYRNEFSIRQIVDLNSFQETKLHTCWYYITLLQHEKAAAFFKYVKRILLFFSCCCKVLYFLNCNAPICVTIFCTSLKSRAFLDCIRLKRVDCCHWLNFQEYSENLRILIDSSLLQLSLSWAKCWFVF